MVSTLLNCNDMVSRNKGPKQPYPRWSRVIIGRDVSNECYSIAQKRTL